MSIYERLMSGETLRVQFKNPVGVVRKGPFSVRRLLTLGDTHYVNESSEWAKFATVGGVVIGGRIRHRMNTLEIQWWCDALLVLDPPKTKEVSA